MKIIGEKLCSVMFQSSAKTESSPKIKCTLYKNQEIKNILKGFMVENFIVWLQWAFWKVLKKIFIESIKHQINLYVARNFL